MLMSCSFCCSQRSCRTGLTIWTQSCSSGEPDAPAEPDAIDGLLDGALPGTAGFQEDTGAQVDFMRDILPEGDEDDVPEPEAAQNGDPPDGE